MIRRGSWVVRLFSLRDIFTIKQLEPQGVAFDLRRLLLDAPSPIRSALVGYFTRHHLGAITCVHESTVRGNRLRGFAQVSPRENRADWDLLYLAPSLDYHANAADIWQRLLTHITVLGAQHGALRICARASEDAEAEDIFRQVGYTVVAREEVFALSQRPTPAPAPRGLRQTSPRDGYGLNDLYCHALPQVVQQAHAFVPWWSGGWPHAPLAIVPVQDYVWAEKDKVLAHLALYSTPRGHWLEVVVRPEHRGDTLPHIKYILTLGSESTPIYCPVSDYGVGLGWLLRTLGFESYTRQVLLVVHTAARVPLRQKTMLTGLERSMDVGTPMGHVSSRVGAPGVPVEQNAVREVMISREATWEEHVTGDYGRY